MSGYADVRSLSEAWPGDRDVRSALRSGHRQVTTAGRFVPRTDIGAVDA